MQWRRDDGYTIWTDPDRVDRMAVWEFLHTSYWSPGIEFERVSQALDNSLPFSLLAADGSQAGFARVVSDRTRFAWLADVFVLEPHRGAGLGIWLVETVLAHPDLQGVRFILATADAHGLYARFGFEPVDSGRMMERRAG